MWSNFAQSGRTAPNLGTEVGKLLKLPTCFLAKIDYDVIASRPQPW